MSTIETAFYASTNKSKVLRNIANRVSFSETLGGSQSSQEKECKTTATTSSLPPSSSTSLALKRTTPILFSTNRGLHLRVTSAVNDNTAGTLQSRGSRHEDDGGGNCERGSNSNSIAANTNRSKQTATTAAIIKSSYSVNFCDLERWSTNRANTVSLEDTFTIAHQPAVVPHSAVSGSLASNSLRFLPHNKSNSIRFKGYARFDVN